MDTAQVTPSRYFPCYPLWKKLFHIGTPIKIEA